MKNLILSLTAMVSLSAFAEESIHIACLNPDMDANVYNASFEINANRLVAYTFDSYDGLVEVEITAEERETGPIYLQYGEWNDTNYGYIINNEPDLTNYWKVTNWTSGNDSDNYEAVENDGPVQCHLLKQKPTSLKVDPKNIYMRVQ